MSLDDRVGRLEGMIELMREQQDAIGEEVLGARRRLHRLESDAAARRALAAEVRALPGRMRQVASEAAQQAIAADRVLRQDGKVRVVGVWTQILSVAIGFAGLAAAIFGKF